MVNQLLYLESPDTYDFSASVAKVLQDGEQTSLILDRSYFYPQGGGQPGDKGTVLSDSLEFLVQNTYLDGDDVVHTGVAVRGEPREGDHVRASIDSRAREFHSKLHTGGHIIMAAADRTKGLKPVKGYHFPNGPYVEFEGTLPQEERESFPMSLQVEVDRLVSEESDEVIVAFEDLHSLRDRGVYIPMELPANKPTRVVKTAGYESPCGGTHAKTLSDLGGIKIRSVKARSGRTKVSYELA